MDKSPLTGQAYLNNTAEVHTYIIKFTSGNSVAEAKMIHNALKNDGRLNFIALKNHYEGVGIHAIGIFKADKIIQYLFYSGKKKPHMWLDEFERQLTDAFNTYDWHEKCSVQSNNQNLCMLNRKNNAEFLQSTKSSINLEICRTPDNLSYDNNIAAFQNQVNQKYLPELSTYNNRRPRRVNQVYSIGGGRGVTFKAEENVITVEEVDVAAKEDSIVDVDKEAEMAEESVKHGI